MGATIKISLFLLALILLGAGAYTSVDHPTFAADNSIIPTVTNTYNDSNFSKASNLRAQMRSLIEEHTVMTGEYLKGLYDGKNISTLKTNLNTNSNTIADVIGDAYGTSARSKFLNMWSMHITQYENYTTATKANDSNMENQAKDNLHAEADTLEQMFNSLNNTSVTNLGNMMKQHIDGTLSLVDAHAAKNSALEAQLMKKGFDQAGQFADYITQILAAEKPSLVK